VRGATGRRSRPSPGRVAVHGTLDRLHLPSSAGTRVPDPSFVDTREAGDFLEEILRDVPSVTRETAEGAG